MSEIENEKATETKIPRKWIYLIVASLLGFIGWIFRDQNMQLKDCINGKDAIIKSLYELEKEKNLNAKLKKIQNDSI